MAHGFQHLVGYVTIGVGADGSLRVLDGSDEHKALVRLLLLRARTSAAAAATEPDRADDAAGHRDRLG